MRHLVAIKSSSRSYWASWGSYCASKQRCCSRLKMLQLSNNKSRITFCIMINYYVLYDHFLSSYIYPYVVYLTIIRTNDILIIPPGKQMRHLVTVHISQQIFHLRSSSQEVKDYQIFFSNSSSFFTLLIDPRNINKKAPAFNQQTSFNVFFNYTHKLLLSWKTRMVTCSNKWAICNKGGTLVCEGDSKVYQGSSHHRVYGGQLKDRSFSCCSFRLIKR